MENLFQHHLPFAAPGADPGIDSRDTGKEFLPGLFFMLPGTINAEEFFAQDQLCRAVSVTQDAIMPDFHETIREDMQEKATDKLGSIQGHQLQGIVITAIPILEGDLVSFHRDQPVIGNGHPMRVSPQIVHDSFSAGKGWLAVHHPLLVIEIIEHGLEGSILFQWGNVSGKNQLSFFSCLFEIGKELSPKQAGEELYGDKEVLLAWYPLFPIRREPAPCHDAVQMRVIHQGL